MLTTHYPTALGPTVCFPTAKETRIPVLAPRRKHRHTVHIHHSLSYIFTLDPTKYDTHLYESQQ